MTRTAPPASCRQGCERNFSILTRFSFHGLTAAASMLFAVTPAAFAQMPPAGGPMPMPGPMSRPMNPGMPPAPPTAPPPIIAPATPGPAGVAAVVNGKKIYRFQVAHQALILDGAKILNTMILIELINQEASKQHIVITPAQIDAKYAEVRQQAASRVPGGLDAVLQQRNQSVASFKEQQLLPQMLAEALVAKTLPTTLRLHARHLLILTTAPGGMAPGAKPAHTDAEALEVIAKAQAELKAGKSFDVVANEYTEDPSGKGKGGDLNLIDASTPFDPNFLKAALALKAGEVTPVPVKSQYGYHLIKIDSTSAAPSAADRKLFDDARRQQIEQAIPAYVNNLRKSAKVVSYFSQ